MDNKPLHYAIMEFQLVLEAIWDLISFKENTCRKTSAGKLRATLTPLTLIQTPLGLIGPKFFKVHLIKKVLKCDLSQTPSTSHIIPYRLSYNKRNLKIWPSMPAICFQSQSQCLNKNTPHEAITHWTLIFFLGGGGPKVIQYKLLKKGKNKISGPLRK
jgi:hypothetical protein